MRSTTWGRRARASPCAGAPEDRVDIIKKLHWRNIIWARAPACAWAGVDVRDNAGPTIVADRGGELRGAGQLPVRNCSLREEPSAVAKPDAIGLSDLLAAHDIAACCDDHRPPAAPKAYDTPAERAGHATLGRLPHQPAIAARHRDAPPTEPWYYEFTDFAVVPN